MQLAAEARRKMLSKSNSLPNFFLGGCGGWGLFKDLDFWTQHQKLEK